MAFAGFCGLVATVVVLQQQCRSDPCRPRSAGGLATAPALKVDIALSTVHLCKTQMNRMSKMRRGLVLAILLLPASGCAVTPGSGYVYAAAPEYPPPAYAEYSDTPDPYSGEAYPGYTFNDEVPMIMEDGNAMPLVLLGDQWGYYDHERRWHHAPDQVWRQVQNRQGPGWSGHPDGPPHYGGYQPPRYNERPQTNGGYYGGPPAGRSPPDGWRYGGPPTAGGRYGGPPPDGGRYSGSPSGDGRYGGTQQDGGRYGGLPPDGGRYGGSPPGDGRYGGAQQDGGYYGGISPNRAPDPVRAPPAPRSPPQPNDRYRDCPPGQRC
jgi:hypothetical protein